MGQIVENPVIPNRVNEGTPKLFYLADGAAIFGCIGNPEGVITANKRSLALSDDGNIYFKTTDNAATGWVVSGGGGGSIGGSIATTQIAVGSAANTISGSANLTFVSGSVGIAGTTNPGVVITGTAATESGITINQAVTGAAADAFVSLASSSDTALFRLTSDTFTPANLVKARQIDFFGGAGIVEFLLRLATASSRFVFGINNGEAVSIQSTTTENLVLGSPSTGAVPRDGQIKFYNETNANYLQLRAGDFPANRIYDLPITSPTGTQALVGSLSGSTITLGWASASGGGSIGGSIASTQIAVGSGVDTITGYSALTYDDANALFFLTKSINAPTSLAVTNSDAGTSAIAQVAASANSAQAVLFATSSAYVTAGLYEANMAVLNLNGSNASLIQGNSAGSFRFALGTSEYARLTSARLGLLSLGLGASAGSLDVLLERDAANTLAQRNGANAQTFRIYNTYTDDSNYERANLGWSSNEFGISTIGAGTGAANRNIVIQTGGGQAIRYVAGSAGNIFTGNIIYSADNTYDFGSSGAARPRNIHVAGYLVTPTIYIGAGASASGFTSSGASGVLKIHNDAGSDFNRLQFGGTTSSFPALGRSGASIVIQLADGTLQTPILPVNTNQLQFGGADAASPGAISLRVQNVLAGTTDVGGQNLSIYGSIGTGSGLGGAIILRVAPSGSTGSAQNATIVGLGIDGTGRLYASAIHNNAAGMAGSTNQYIGSGTYSPTITAVANCTVTTPGVNFKYLRVGNIVQVTGQLSVDPTTASTLTRARIALPIASNLTGSVGCQGVGACGDVFGLSGAIFPDTTNDAAELNFICETGTPANNVWVVSFSYEVA